jgi:DNA topoisomerase I
MKRKRANVQDAHEAIRPTSLKYTPEFVKNFWTANSFKLYELIWKRFLASQMSKAAQVETTVVEIKADEFLFKALGSQQFNGFLQVYDDFRSRC